MCEKPRPFRSHVSCGIACCRVNPAGQYEVLMVNKRNTYAFIDFVCGKYNGLREAQRLFARTTMDEKLDIASMNFDQMWYRAWLTDSHSERSAHFERCRNKFYATFICPHRTRYAGIIRNWEYKRDALRLMLDRAPSVTRIWEIPKGRLRGPESDVECAVREFGEETGIKKTAYRIIPGWTRKNEITDCGARYTSQYFLATATENIVPRVGLLTDSQISEIVDIRWVSAELAMHLPGCEASRLLVRDIIKTMKRAVSAQSRQQ